MICDRCHKAFQGRASQAYCSNACRQAAYRERQRPTFDVLRDKLLQSYEDISVYLIVTSQRQRAQKVLQNLFIRIGSDLMAETNVTRRTLRDWIGD